MNFDRMRALLLDRAIHGQLVSQDADDGVVKQIGMTPDADPFTLPKSWRWIKLKELVIPAKQTGVSGFLCLGRLFQGQPNEAALCI